jgi:hypothetical protein
VPLTILGATYGLSDITPTLAAYVDSHQEIRLPAVGTVLDDPWPGRRKSLVVVYQYGAGQPQTMAVGDDQPLTITYDSSPAAPSPGPPDQLQILGAAYGIGPQADVTAAVARLVANNTLQLTANNATFQDTWGGVVKTCTVVYRYGGGPPQIATCAENEPIQVGEQPNYALQLTGGAYLASSTIPSFDSGDLTVEVWLLATGPGPILSALTVDQRTGITFERLAFGVGPSGVLALQIAAAAPGMTGPRRRSWRSRPPRRRPTRSTATGTTSPRCARAGTSPCTWTGRSSTRRRADRRSPTACR